MQLTFRMNIRYQAAFIIPTCASIYIYLFALNSSLFPRAAWLDVSRTWSNLTKSTGWSRILRSPNWSLRAWSSAMTAWTSPYKLPVSWDWSSRKLGALTHSCRWDPDRPSLQDVVDICAREVQHWWSAACKYHCDPEAAAEAERPIMLGYCYWGR